VKVSRHFNCQGSLWFGTFVAYWSGTDRYLSERNPSGRVRDRQMTTTWRLQRAEELTKNPIPSQFFILVNW
jgi:hypothetical protein